MENIYSGIAQRTGGHIYIGVVGPVRTGKSTFIKQFMEKLILPNITDPTLRDRAMDELPQSGSGKTIMTAEPKFVPEEAVCVTFPGSVNAAVRLIDSVGYLVEGAVGVTEEGEPRMVKTPWFDSEVTLEQAAREGTNRIIRDHATMAVLVTTDGSVTQFDRESYLSAEQETVQALHESGVPFVMVLNCEDPEKCSLTASKLEEKYGCKVCAMNCQTAKAEEFTALLEQVLYQFPLQLLRLRLPRWFSALEPESPVRRSVTCSIQSSCAGIDRLRDVAAAAQQLAQSEYILSVTEKSMDPAAGEAVLEIALDRSIFFDTVNRITGLEIEDEGELLPILRELAEGRSRYENIAAAMEQVMQTGYGIVHPTPEQMQLTRPEPVRRSGRCGVRLEANAPTVHMIRADVVTDVSPIVGDEKQSAQLLDSLRQQFENSPEELWQWNIFGRSLHELVSEGMHTKLNNLTDDARDKFRTTLQKVINEGTGTLICIML